jgi:hypothetical protein
MLIVLHSIRYIAYILLNNNDMEPTNIKITYWECRYTATVTY